MFVFVFLHLDTFLLKQSSGFLFWRGCFRPKCEVDERFPHFTKKAAFSQFLCSWKSCQRGFFQGPFFKLSCTFIFTQFRADGMLRVELLSRHVHNREKDRRCPHYENSALWLKVFVLACSYFETAGTFQWQIELWLVRQKKNNLPSVETKGVLALSWTKTRQQTCWRVELKGSCRLIHFAWAAPWNIYAYFFFSHITV